MQLSSSQPEALAGMTAPEPLPFVDKDGYCHPQCPFLSPGAGVAGVCTRDGKPLAFYDWYLAHCQTPESASMPQHDVPA
jgi:hypothetical protein